MSFIKLFCLKYLPRAEIKINAIELIMENCYYPFPQSLLKLFDYKKEEEKSLVAKKKTHYYDDGYILP